MTKYGFGVILTATSFGVLGYVNVNLITGIFSAIAVIGIACMIGGLAGDILTVVTKIQRDSFDMSLKGK